MNLKIVYFILITFFFSNIVSSEEIDCNKFEKMSAKYIQCNAVKFKSKTDKKANQLKVKTNQKANEIKTKTGEKLESSGITNKLKKFKNSKTLKEFTEK